MRTMVPNYLESNPCAKTLLQNSQNTPNTLFLKDLQDLFESRESLATPLLIANFSSTMPTFQAAHRNSVRRAIRLAVILVDQRPAQPPFWQQFYLPPN